MIATSFHIRVSVLQDRVEGAALLEAAELRGDDSDADELSDSDADSDINTGSSDGDSEVHDSEAAESSDEDTKADGLETAVPSPEVEATSDAESGHDSEDSESGRGEQSEGSDSDGALADSPSTSGFQHSDIEQHSDVEQQEEEETAPPGRGRKRKAHSLESDSECFESDQDEAAPESAQRDHHEKDEHDEEEEEEDQGGGRKKRKDAKPKLQPAADSLQTLKKQLAAAKGTGGDGEGKDGQAGVPIEWGRVLTAEDFERIKQLRHRCTTPTCFPTAPHTQLPQGYVENYSQMVLLEPTWCF